MSFRILVVEDEPLIAEDIAQTLEKQGYVVAGIAGSSTKALDMLVTKTPDLALLDISIKGDKNGIDLAEIINSKYKIPFIYLTSYSDMATLERARTSLPSGYIVKPFKDKDLLSSIEMAIYRHQHETRDGFPSSSQLEERSGLHFTNMEYEILKLLWQGLPNKEIGLETHTSVNTVKTHLKNIFSKLNAKSRNEVIVVMRNWQKR